MKPKLKPEATFGELPVGARFRVPWTGETFVKIAASNCGVLVARNTIEKPVNFGDSIRVRQVGDATTLPVDPGVPIIPKDDDIVDFVLDDSLCNAATQHDSPTDYLRRPARS